MTVRIQMKYPVHETQQMLGDILNVFVQQAQQPYGHDYGKQTLAGFKDGNAAQTKMFRYKVLLGIHGRGQNFILYVSNAFWMI
jgi:hypothetical protein